MKNKKAILMPETLKIILAVIGIALLIYLSVSLYGIFRDKTKIEQAKANLENIRSIINNLEEGETQEYLIESPKDWNFLFFSKEKESPLACGLLNCLCFCDDDDKEDCDEKGVCQSIEEKIRFETEKENKINLDEIPQRIYLSRINNEIIIGKRSGATGSW